MSARSLVKWASMVVATFVFVASAAAQGTESLGTVRVPRAVTANGEVLPAGTYTVRVSSEPVKPVVGQSAAAAVWVEFVQAGAAKGRELASVVSPAELKDVSPGGTPPTPGSARVQVLRGGEYLRVWLNRAGTQYLVHLFAAAK